MTTTDERRERVRQYLRERGWTEDRWGNLHHPTDGRRYKLGQRNLKLQAKHSKDLGGRWFNIRSIPYGRLKLFTKGEGGG